MTKPMWYDRSGRPLVLADGEPDYTALRALRENDSYKRVAETTLESGAWISTVWLGLDHNFGDKGPPLIFETMVFNQRPDAEHPWHELDMDRYATLDEAKAGHDRMVQKWYDRTLDTPGGSDGEAAKDQDAGA